MKIESRFYKTDHSKAYLIGSGISTLAAAIHCIREGFNPKNVHVLEKHTLEESGNAQGNANDGYYLCGTNIIDQEMYSSLFELLNIIPSITQPGKTLREDILDFSKEHPLSSECRLVTMDLERVDTSHSNLALKESSTLSLLLVVPESTLDGRTIKDYFTDDFFKSTFWHVFSTTFAFRETHSLIEFKRYVKRFMGDYPKIADLSKFWRTPMNQYESLVQPMEKFLRDQGVVFENNISSK
jgi:oleate hydratase